MQPQTHEDLRSHLTIRGSSDRQFGVVAGLFWIAVSLWPLRSGGLIRAWALIAGALFLGLGILAPAVLRPLNRAWTAVGLLLSRVTNPVVAALLFYLVFTPCGLVMRLVGKDPLRLMRDPRAPTYWIERRPPGPSPESMVHPF